MPQAPEPPNYLTPYVDAEKRLGPGFEATLWARRETQEIRFRVFAEQLDLSGKTILDAGCGPGDFAAWLQTHGIGYGRYVGIDGVEPVVEHANARGLPDAEFRAGDLVTDAALLATGSPEVTIISGTLNTMDLATATRVLENAWAGTSSVLAFNFLPDTAGPGATPQLHPAVRLPTMHLLAWALAQTWDVLYRQDYFAHGHDGTVVMRKHARA
ncbi:class I SAM-dependent methyltransferase [Phycisphaera mikurensis]|uniref:Methyltransferase domain-containing protein n=1 Tax=Phycisphaera mikurensis (strain NBRC 102666 / KCTC 22515 / FYK2301M01) TaxID=1142394 RepID=I0ID54_PHYMF|nr:class I SAM-dependent methyltransferase [Phycisphaera mikurensis]MBB6442316.1 SAM-dependent methyltransferase [Phycisphaera mikurensis]BAM03192.1 hypothetical protein PSMK_10330 [Phycisphaera mikurensis NBRC 102666]